jgi:hypothetical protein
MLREKANGVGAYAFINGAEARALLAEIERLRADVAWWRERARRSDIEAARRGTGPKECSDAE